MGYLCPVCEEPFGDAAACADHLAVTAILHGGPHERWLDGVAEDSDRFDETVDDRDDVTDDWESIPRSEIAAIVQERAEETTDHDHVGDHGHADHRHANHDHDYTHPAAGRGESTPSAGYGESTDQLDAEARRILTEAQELTRTMQRRGSDGEREGKES